MQILVINHLRYEYTDHRQGLTRSGLGPVFIYGFYPEAVRLRYEHSDHRQSLTQSGSGFSVL